MDKNYAAVLCFAQAHRTLLRDNVVAAPATCSRAQRHRLDMDYASVEPQSLILFGQGGELFMGEEGDGSAEERIRTLLGDGSDRGLARRRIRRPLSGGYQSQSGLVFSERERDGGDPLSELLAHLNASRTGQAALRSRGDPIESAAALSGLSQLAAEESKPLSVGQQLAESTPAHGRLQAQRCRFMQELMLSAMAASPDTLRLGPLGEPLPPASSPRGDGSAHSC